MGYCISGKEVQVPDSGSQHHQLCRHHRVPTLPKQHCSLTLLCQSRVVLSLLSAKAAWSSLSGMAAVPGFKSHRQSSSAAPFPTPPTISYTCQHSQFFQLYWAAIVSLGRCGPMARSQSSPSSHAGPVTRGVASQLHLGWKSLPSPYLKAGPQLVNISMKLVKGYRFVK